MSQNPSSIGGTFQKIITILVLLLITWNIYRGATVQKIGIPGFEIAFEPPESPASESQPKVNGCTDISGKYLMDQLQHRVVVLTYITDCRFRIEEPSGSWPWEGTATLDGGSLSGDAKVKVSLASMRIRGTLHADGSIDVEYIFMTGSDGSPANGRVDRHVWYPAR